MIDKDTFVAIHDAWDERPADINRARRFEATCKDLASELGIFTNQLRADLAAEMRREANKRRAFDAVIEKYGAACATEEGAA